MRARKERQQGGVKDKEEQVKEVEGDKERKKEETGVNESVRSDARKSEYQVKYENG